MAFVARGFVLVLIASSEVASAWRPDRHPEREAFGSLAEQVSSVAAFRLALSIGQCERPYFVGSKVPDPETWQDSASDPLHYALSDASDQLIFRQGFEVPLQCAGFFKKKCTLALRLHRPGIEESMIEDCVEIDTTSSAAESIDVDQRSACAEKLGVDIAHLAVSPVAGGGLLCVRLGGTRESIEQLVFIADLSEDTGLGAVLEDVQRKQDPNVWFPYRIAGIASKLSDEDSRVFNRLAFLAMELKETTRDRESLMAEACKQASVAIQKSKLAQEAEMGSPDGQLSRLLTAFCGLAGRDEFGAPSVYAIDNDLEAPSFCQAAGQAEGSGKWLQSGCERFREAAAQRRQERVALTRRAAVLASQVRLKASPRERVVIVGGGLVGLLHALAAKLTGASVQVLEGRAEFTRLNVMHVKAFLAEIEHFGIDQIQECSDYVTKGKYISAANGQRLLARAAAAYGVELRMNHEFLAYCPPTVEQGEWPDDKLDKWFAVFTRQTDGDFDSLAPPPRISAVSPTHAGPEWLKAICEHGLQGVSEHTVRFEYDLLVAAEGTRSPSRDQGALFGRREAGSVGGPLRGPFGEAYQEITLIDADTPTVPAAVVAVRADARGWRRPNYGTQLHKPRFNYQFPYMTRKTPDGYWWTGFILGKATADVLETSGRDAVKLARNLIKTQWNWGKNVIGVSDLVFDQRHQPHVAVFNMTLRRATKVVALQSASDGTQMALLVAGDAAVTPYFPKSSGLNGGASRLRLGQNDTFNLAGVLLGALRSQEHVQKLQAVEEAILKEISTQWDGAVKDLSRRI